MNTKENEQKGTPMEKYHYYMFNKPCGCVTARKDDKHKTVMDYFEELHNDRLSPVGRLDRETEGLLIITDDGGWNQLMTNPANKKKKVYEFIVFGNVDEKIKEKLEKGILLKNSSIWTAPAELEITCRTDFEHFTHIKKDMPQELLEKIKNNRPDNPVTFGRITITEGRKRQVRRMFKAVGCYVIYLKRVQIDDIVLDESLKPGEWKEIKVR